MNDKKELITFLFESQDFMFDGHAFEKNETLVYLKNDKYERVCLVFDRKTLSFLRLEKAK